MAEKRVRVLLYWDGVIGQGVNGSQYSASPKRLILVDPTTRWMQLVQLLHHKTGIDSTQFKLKVLCRYPLFVTDQKITYTSAPVEDDDFLNDVLSIPKRFPNMVAVELYIDQEPVTNSSRLDGTQSFVPKTNLDSFKHFMNVEQRGGVLGNNLISAHPHTQRYRPTVSTMEFWKECLGYIYHASSNARDSDDVDPIGTLEWINKLAAQALSLSSEDRCMTGSSDIYIGASTPKTARGRDRGQTSLSREPLVAILEPSSQTETPIDLSISPLTRSKPGTPMEASSYVGGDHSPQNPRGHLVYTCHNRVQNPIPMTPNSSERSTGATHVEAQFKQVMQHRRKQPRRNAGASPCGT